MTWIKGLRLRNRRCPYNPRMPKLEFMTWIKGLRLSIPWLSRNSSCFLIRIYDLNKGITTFFSIAALKPSFTNIRIYDLNKGITTPRPRFQSLQCRYRLEFMTWIKGLRLIIISWLIYYYWKILEFMTWIKGLRLLRMVYPLQWNKFFIRIYDLNKGITT